ncbi:CAP domain-containing protein [Sediminibacterium soli]|uniref:CAP domain-containing protein n=1 Tax=Sediminibacterium soli TaxID=2698829 RepID=UPI00137A627A|nr:CAP domain-containing protein [Sediminibacterium soli]NCI47906.1 CAP domain-containing protein [Sediminibacterium soli]
MKPLVVFLLLVIPFLAPAQMGSVSLPDKPIPRPAMQETDILNWNNSQPGYARLSTQAQEFLYWVNFGRSRPQQFWDSVLVPVLQVFPSLKGPESTSLYTDLKQSGALPMFSLNPTLVSTAQAHALDIAGKKASPSHTSTNGTDFFSRMKKAGIRYCASENIAISSNSTLLAVLLLYLDIGLPEKGHRKSLLNRGLTETGIGSALYGKDQDFFVQDLSCAQ